VPDRIRGLNLGADDYVLKPVDLGELAARLRALVRRAHGQPQDCLVAQDVVLDPAARAVRQGGQPVTLSTREFDLLHFLLKHPGRPFSRAELLQRVWGDGFDGYEHTVNSHINRLRGRIEDDPRDPRRVVTVWGVGYRFDPEPAP